jgi:hypothetical protein
MREPGGSPLTEPTWWVRVFMSGPIEAAKQALRAECLREGLCVTVDPTVFVYTGGEESGYVVGLINYPRVPQPPEVITARGHAIANLLLDATFQHSALVMTPAETTWITRRPQ